MCIHKAKTFRCCLAGKLLHGTQVVGRGNDDRRARLRCVQDFLRNGSRLVVGGHNDYEDLRLPGRLSKRFSRRKTGRLCRGPFLDVNIGDHDIMASIFNVAGHRQAHGSDADDCNFHVVPLFICRRPALPRPRPSIRRTPA